MKTSQARPVEPTGLIAFADGSVLHGMGLGAAADAVGEVCFNTAMSGYQEILTDPSYAGQIITFTFPHIGNVGANDDDREFSSPPASTAARGVILRADVTSPSNYRARLDLHVWLKRRGIIGVAGVDTRALTNRIREEGMLHATIAHRPAGGFDEAALIEKAKAWSGIEGRDLAKSVTAQEPFAHEEPAWRWNEGYGEAPSGTGRPHVVVIDFGVKKNILRLLTSAGARVSVAPATSSLEDITAMNPDGVVLSNGPGDPAATAEYAKPLIQGLIAKKTPLFGICLGHQLLAQSVGAKTLKMRQGHHGANHPVKDHATGRVEIVSMNHGFAVDAESLPDGVEATYTSLFDGTNCGIRLKDAPAASVQHHPEASPGPQDSFGVFKAFVSGLSAAA
ncbi:MAG: glutamine-hydrolyzing carbamoyl-phosphate synthase small subunit [Pseudomonadota bacterium]